MIQLRLLSPWLAIAVSACSFQPAASGGHVGVPETPATDDAAGYSQYLKLSSTSNRPDFKEPPVLTDVTGPSDEVVEVHVTAKEVLYPLHPDADPGDPNKVGWTKMWLFGDSGMPGQRGAQAYKPSNQVAFTFPGPTIRATEGNQVIVHVHNELTDLPVNTHFHGMVIPPETDGAPMNLISPNRTHTYTWHAKDGFPMTGWFHGHTHGLTHLHVQRGLVGFIDIVPRGGNPLAGYPDHIAMLWDNKLETVNGLSNQIPLDTQFDRFNGREGNLVWVNQGIHPIIKMQPGSIHRLRILNGSNGRFFDLKISDGARNAAKDMPFTLVGTDGGLIKWPERHDRLVLANAERVEVLIQAPPPGEERVLWNMPFDRGLGVRRGPEKLMTFKSDGGPVAMTMPTGPLRDVPDLLATMRQQGVTIRNRTFELDRISISVPNVSRASGRTHADHGGSLNNHFAIDKKVFDPYRKDNIVEAGTAEIWTIENKSGNWDHPMHLHNLQFQVLDVDGVPFHRAGNPVWKDVVRVPANSTVRLIAQFPVPPSGTDPANLDILGHYMFHCHILQHEDDGMMTTVFVDQARPFDRKP